MVLPLVVALVLDPECSLRCGQVSPILLKTLMRSGHNCLPLFSRRISVGYLVVFIRLRRLCLAFIRSIMSVLFLSIDKNMLREVGGSASSKIQGLQMTAVAFPLTMRSKTSLEVHQLKFHGPLPFPVSVDYAKSYTNLL